MSPAWIIATSVLATLLVFFGLRIFTQRLRARGRAAIDQRFSPSAVLRAETLAQSFGQQSKGTVQWRGSGALALTNTELCFVMYVLNRELRIPLAAITGVSIVRSHLGKTQFSRLLHVQYTIAGADDAIAWRLTDPAAWKSTLDAVCHHVADDAIPSRSTQP